MNNLGLEETSFTTFERLSLPKTIDRRGDRLKIAGGVIGGLVLLVLILQIFSTLSQQQVDMSGMGDKIQKLQQDNQSLKNSVGDQTKIINILSSDLDSTKSRLETTRQDLDDAREKVNASQKESLDLMKKEFDTQKMQIEELRQEMADWKQGYSSVLADSTKKDEEYRNDIKTILQKIQSLDIGSINDRIYELQMSEMNLEKKLITPNQTPFDSSNPSLSASKSLN